MLFRSRVIMTTNEYLEKIASVSRSKRIFDENYFIGRLDARKRKEMIESIGETIGFLV